MDQDVFRNTGAELFVGNAPVERPFDLLFIGKSATDEMLGLGLALDLLLPEGQETIVPLKFRKPVGYVAGQNQVHVLNVLAGKGENVELASLTMNGVTDLAATPNGALVLAAADTNLIPLRTADHQVQDTEKVTLPAPATCIAVSPDSRYALVCHKAQSSVSIVNLDQMGSAKASVETTKVKGEPGKVVFC